MAPHRPPGRGDGPARGGAGGQPSAPRPIRTTATATASPVGSTRAGDRRIGHRGARTLRLEGQRGVGARADRRRLPGRPGHHQPGAAAQDCPAVQVTCLAAPSGGDPEIDQRTLRRGRVLHAGARRARSARDRREHRGRRGAEVFVEAGCASCHTPTLHDGRVRHRGPGRPDDPPPHRPAPARHGSGSGRRPSRLRARPARSGAPPPLWGIGLAETRQRAHPLPARRTGPHVARGGAVARRRGRGGAAVRCRLVGRDQRPRSLAFLESL